MIDREWWFERIPSKNTDITYRESDTTAIVLINGEVGVRESGFVWASPHIAAQYQEPLGHTLPFVEENRSEEETRRVTIQKNGEPIQQKYVIKVHEHDTSDHPSTITAMEGCWIDPAVFYQPKKTDIVSSYVIDHAFQSPIMREIVSFNNSKNNHRGFLTRKGILD